MDARLRIALANIRSLMAADADLYELRKMQVALVEVIQASRGCRDDAEAAVRKTII